MEYDDFIVAIGPDLGEGHAVQVRSPAGEGKGVLKLPFPPEVLSFFASGTWLAWQVIYRRGERAPDPFDGHFEPYLDMTPEALGDLLFRSLFTGEVESLFRESLGRAGTSGRGLRLRIELDPRDSVLSRLYSLPWELLYREDTGDFLGLSRETPLVRYLPVPRPPRPLRCSTIRILAVAAQPKEMKGLQIRKEQRDLHAAWGRFSGARIVMLRKAGLEILRRELLRRDYHVLHFIGHGELSQDDGEGVLFFETEDGGARPVSGRALAAELKDFKSLRLAVLNACETGKESAGGTGRAFAGVATALVLGGLPAVVAMQAPIPDSCATAFSRTFYQRLAAGDAVDTALTEGRLAIRRLNEKAVDWATPSLFLRSPDGRLFQKSAWRRRGWIAVLLALALLAGVGSLWLAREEAETGRREAARKLYEEGLQIVEDRGPDDLAAKAFQAALELDPDLAVARCGLAGLERVRGVEMTRVVDDCRLALQQSPDDPVLHYQVGVLYADWGRLEEARSALEGALQLDPEYTAACNALGDVFLRLDDPAAAQTVLEKGLRSAGDPVPAPLLKNLARVDLHEGRTDAAITRLRQALAQAGAGDRREILFLLAEAQARSHPREGGEACATLALLVRGPESLGVGEWERRGRELARELACPAPSAAAPLPEVARSALEPRARALLRAAITDFDGQVTVSSGPGGEGLRRAHRSLVIPEGQLVTVGPGAWAEIVCSSDTRVYLEGRREWRLDAEGCREGEPLFPNAYFSVAPEAGRVRFRGDERLPVLEQRMRGAEDNPLWPTLLHPRNTAILEARPEIVWTGVAKAYEYEIELVGCGIEAARIEAGTLSCGRSPHFPASPTVCRAPYPASFPDLAPGREELLRLWVRPSIAANRTGSMEGLTVRRLPEAQAAEVRNALQEIDATVRGEATRRLLRAGAFARARLWGAALTTCQEALAEDDRPALRVTLGGLFLEVGLLRQAEASYETALRAEPETAVRAAAELGLGRVAAARREDKEAREHFRKAGNLFAAAGLTGEAEAARKLLQQIGT